MLISKNLKKLHTFFSLSLMIFSASILFLPSSSYATNKSKIKNKGLIKKSIFIENFEKDAPSKVCNLLSETFVQNKGITLDGIGENNKKCMKLIRPLVYKYVNQYSHAFPEYLTKNKMQTYAQEVTNSAGSEYIKYHTEIPTKIFLEKYTQEQMIEPLCHNSKDVKKSTCVKNMTKIMRICTTKEVSKLPKKIRYSEFKTANKSIQNCFLGLYLKKQIFPK